LAEALRLTPFAREEFLGAYESRGDLAFDLAAHDGRAPEDSARACACVERARRLIIKSLMGHGSDGATRDRFVTGFRANSNRSGTTPAHDWMTYPAALSRTIERLRGVVIEHRDAIQVMAAQDGPDTLHYVDPPYLPETRQVDHRHHGYRHELEREDHARLLAQLAALRGMVVLSGYPAALYDDALPDWRRFEIDAFADGAKPRKECVWLNPACLAALNAAQRQPSLFGART
jgi:DNA adenine methylase